LRLTWICRSGNASGSAAAALPPEPGHTTGSYALRPTGSRGAWLALDDELEPRADELS
jgi:hypothetical protein